MKTDIELGKLYGYKQVLKDVEESEVEKISKLSKRYLENLSKEFLEEMNADTLKELKNFPI